MSKALYDDVQRFLSDAWGPMGGWYQAVVFAADLNDTDGNRSTKRKGVKSNVKDVNSTKRSRSTRVKTETK